MEISDSLVPIGRLEDLRRDCSGVGLSDRFDYSFCDLSGRDLSDGVYNGFSFLRSNLSGVKFSKKEDIFANGEEIISCGEDLDEPTLIPCVGEKADLEGRVYSDLVEANFVKSNLSYADFTACDLGGADLSKSNISYSDFSYANLCGTNMTVDKYEGVSFKGSFVDIDTKVFFDILKQMVEDNISSLEIYFSDGISVEVDEREIQDLEEYIQVNKMNNIYVNGKKRVIEEDIFEEDSFGTDLEGSEEILDSNRFNVGSWLKIAGKALKTVLGVRVW